MTGSKFAFTAYILPISLGIVAIAFLCVAVILFVRLMRQQIRLYNSIILIELKSPKMAYWALFFITLLLLIYCVINIISPAEREIEFFLRVFLAERAAVIFIYCCFSLILGSNMLIFFALAISKCAVVDRGVYTKIHFYDWYNIYDYFVNEKNNTVILTKNKQGPLSLQGMSPPLIFSDSDIERLKFILNKNKNKFLAHYDLR